jgi:ABC-type sugar transport system substrate-binding protein
MAEQVQSFALDSQNDPVLQAEYASWLIRQRWLKGIILTPFDEQTGGQIVATAMKQKVPLVVVDRPVKSAHFSVMSDNEQGGEYAAEMLREQLPGESLVLAYGPRNIISMFNRMDGFFRKAESYHWQVVEVFTPAMNLEQAKQSILEGLNSNPDAKGIFLTNEFASVAYIELFRKGQLPQQQLYTVSYDINAEIAQAITDGELIGTIFQDPVRLGSVAAQELVALLQQPLTETPSTPKEVLVPVKKITRENLASEWHPPEEN